MKPVMETYKRLGIAPVEGRGSWLIDERGDRYLDFIGGIATNSLGHAHPALVSAIKEQAEKLIHCSNLYRVPLQEEVARMLTEATDFDRVFFCNSGTESVEAAIKLARRHAHRTAGPHKHEILTFTGSFHGRTYGGLTATAQPALHEGFAPMVGGFSYAPYGDLEAAGSMIGPQTAAVIVEPIQGESGVNEPPEGFLAGLRELCDEHGALLIFDEVQTGVGRTGHLYAYQGTGVVPDVVTSAKGLGGGVPVGAVLAKEEPAAALTPGSHGSTFGGNPLAMAAARAVLQTVREPGFLEEVRVKGAILKNGLRELAARVPGAQVRGRGLLLGLELGPDLAPEVFRRCLKEKVLVNLIGGKTLRMAPPLTVSRTEVRYALCTFRSGVESLKPAPAEAVVA
ncbi:MAG: aspartate aminotransferase family protein [Rubrobacter sp.]|nr:aspartate aminotransferase family protein [Rubrobacter sp.]